MAPGPAIIRRVAVPLTLIVSVCLLAESALAMKRGTAVECVRDGVRKRIEVVANPRPGRVCEVWYADTKTGWTNKIMWYGESDRDYCHSRADGLVATLARTHWVCDVIRKSKVAVDITSEADESRNQDTMRLVDEARSDDSIMEPEEPEEAGDGGGKPALVVPRPPAWLGADTNSGEFRGSPDQTGGEPSVIVPQPRR